MPHIVDQVKSKMAESQQKLERLPAPPSGDLRLDLCMQLRDLERRVQNVLDGQADPTRFLKVWGTSMVRLRKVLEGSRPDLQLPMELLRRAGPSTRPENAVSSGGRTEKPPQTPTRGPISGRVQVREAIAISSDDETNNYINNDDSPVKAEPGSNQRKRTREQGTSGPMKKARGMESGPRVEGENAALGDLNVSIDLE